MNIVCYNAICFSIEFIKLYLLTSCFLKIKQQKNIYASFTVTLFIIMFASIWYNISSFSLIFGITSIILLMINVYEKKKVWIIPLLYLGTSAIDMVFSSICIVLFHLNTEMILNNALLGIGLNCFSLVIIFIGTAILNKKNRTNIFLQLNKYFLLYLAGGMALSLYLTAIQFMGLGESLSTYRYGLVLGLSLSSLILIIACVLLIINSNENEYLKREASINENLLKAQQEYYTLLLQKEQETKLFRHDFKKHIYCMKKLSDLGKYEELKKYLADISDAADELSPKVQTGNDLITAIINDLLEKFPEVQLKWTGMFSSRLKLSSLDTCTIFYNLLSNSFEAADETDTKEVDVKIKFMESTMVAIITNFYETEPVMTNGYFISTKKGDNHGCGIRNIKKCVEKNNGMYSVKSEAGMFTAEVILPNII